MGALDDLKKGLGGGNSVKFTDVGSTVDGTITAWEMRTVKNYEETADEEVFVISLERNDLDDDSEDTEADLYCQKPALRFAITEAVEGSGASDLAVGGRLVIERVEDGEPRNPKHSPPHQFEAAYRPPKSAVASGGAKKKRSLLDDEDDD